MYYSIQEGTTLRTTKKDAVLQSTTKCYSVLQSIILYYTWTVQYNARSYHGNAKHNVTATFMIPCAEHWNVHYSARSNSWRLKVAFRHSFAPPTQRILREGFIQQNQNVRLATAACIKNSGNARFATVACAKMYESCVSPKFRAMDPSNPARGAVRPVCRAF